MRLYRRCAAQEVSSTCHGEEIKQIVGHKQGFPPMLNRRAPTPFRRSPPRPLRTIRRGIAAVARFLLMSAIANIFVAIGALYRFLFVCASSAQEEYNGQVILRFSTAVVENSAGTGGNRESE
ncbi:MAG: hypothetical protein IVW55_13865 [Chloroflexi bacterium]|nr:hypothetical protein [Chloroflexota bacterium]